VKGLDTNVLVRYLTQDDPAQSRRANAMIAETIAAGERCFVGAVVLCEMIWVLRGAYKLEKATVVLAVERILATAQFDVDQKDLVRQALEDYRKGKADFSDYLIGHQNREAGCVETVTFDRRLKGSDFFRVLSG
jgi:predicted nucleic-acid-binding protein